MEGWFLVRVGLSGECREGPVTAKRPDSINRAYVKGVGMEMMR